MNKIISVSEIILGIGALILAVVPTPDDLTIISPLAQAGAGIYLISDGIHGLRR